MYVKCNKNCDKPCSRKHPTLAKHYLNKVERESPSSEWEEMLIGAIKRRGYVTWSVYNERGNQICDSNVVEVIIW